MAEEKNMNVYLLAFDTNDQTSQFMKGLLTGFSESVVDEFKAPWDGMMLVKSPLSANDLSSKISKNTSNMSHILVEMSEKRQGMMSHDCWEFMKKTNNSSEEKE